MIARFFCVLCIQSLFNQYAFSQYIRGPALGYPYEGYGPCGAIASTGGTFPVTSVSPIPPTGLSVVSEAVFEGPLIVGGAAPFLSAVAIEGVLPTAGVGAVSYGCGGEVAITSEWPISPATYSPGPYAPGPYTPAPYAPASYAPGPYAAPYAAPYSPAAPLYGPGLGYPTVGCGYSL